MSSPAAPHPTTGAAGNGAPPADLTDPNQDRRTASSRQVRSPPLARLTKVAGGKTYSQVSAEWIAGGMKSTKLATQRATLFTGETLKGLLLNAWGWATIATLAGIILIILGAILALLPLANWRFNLRGRQVAA